MSGCWRGILLCLMVSSVLPLTAADNGPDGNDFFEKKIRPLLADNCYSCHGPEKQKGHLRMDSRTAILKGGETGPAAVPGKPAASLIIQAVKYQGDLQMPPKAKLNAEVADLLERWVAMDMPWPGDNKIEVAQKAGFKISDEQRAFWCFQPVKPQAVPAVKNTAWPKTDVDRFILAGLEAKNLKPAQIADKRTLIRRATFDLTGLPPAQAEVEAFLADNTPEAFSKVVDRLLASPQYGERWGRHWLDVVRFADSRDSRGSGSEGDIGEAWRYRDWVVQSFNQDLPYDKFVIHQIAGDLLPPEKPGMVNADGLVATTVLSIGEWGAGDADKDKMMTDIVDDQIDLVSRSFMGLTMACARCHDHKFDPISAQDYYALAGIFFSTHIIANPGKKTDGTPNMKTPLIPKEEAERITKHNARVTELEKGLKTGVDQAFATLSKDLLPKTSAYLKAALEYPDSTSLPEFAKSRNLQEFALQQWVDLVKKRQPKPAPYALMKRNARDIGGNPGVYQWKGDPDCPSMMINTNDNSVAIGTLKLPAKSVSVHPGPKSGVTVSWQSPINGNVRISGKVSDSDNVCGDGIAWVIEHQTEKSSLDLAMGEFANGASQPLTGNALNQVQVKVGDVLHLVILPKAEYTCDTTTVEWNIEALESKQDWRIPRDLVAEPLQGNPHADTHGNKEVWRFTDTLSVNRTTSGPADLVKLLNRVIFVPPTEQAGMIDTIQKEITAAPADSALTKMLLGAGSPFVPRAKDEALLPVDVREKFAAMRKEVEDLKRNPPPPVPMCLAVQDGGVPTSIYAGVNDTKLLVRGYYKRPGDVVPRRFPVILAGENQEPISKRTKNSGRLELAQWIASPEHPLTARVMVNRIWQFHFGEGIVRTPSNFGKLGDRPTHPELLDYLAGKFVASGWSIKAMHRLMMNSAAYQLSSRPDKELLATDGDNKLFGRMTRHRLEAEELRDSLLFASGALDPKMGGPSERDAMMARRMLYFITIRSDRSSFGPLFDGADSTAQVPKRTISTVAPQALFMLDNEFINKQAGTLAKTLLDQKIDDAARIEKAYQRLYNRPPGDKEREIGLDYLKKASEAKRPEMQVWTEYAQILLCANEFVFVD